MKTMIAAMAMGMLLIPATPACAAKLVMNPRGSLEQVRDLAVGSVRYDVDFIAYGTATTFLEDRVGARTAAQALADALQGSDFWGFAVRDGARYLGASTVTVQFENSIGWTVADSSGSWSVVGPYGNWSSARFNVAAVPEPATWAMMVLGFAAIGYGLRRRRSQKAVVA